MNFKFGEALEILEKTPYTLDYLLVDLSGSWITCNEGDNTWNVSQVIDHLIEAENLNWVPRLEIILQGGNQQFPPFDRYGHLKVELIQSLPKKLLAFKTLRERNIDIVKQTVNPVKDLNRTGIHPEFGEVKVQELLSTWVVHDLTHISQIVRVMAKRYREDVGPWKEYLGILNKG